MFYTVSQVFPVGLTTVSYSESIFINIPWLAYFSRVPSTSAFYDHPFKQTTFSTPVSRYSSRITQTMTDSSNHIVSWHQVFSFLLEIIRSFISRKKYFYCSIPLALLQNLNLHTASRLHFPSGLKFSVETNLNSSQWIVSRRDVC